VRHDPHANEAAGNGFTSAEVQVVDLGVVVIGPAMLHRVEQSLQGIIEITPPAVRRVQVDRDRETAEERSHRPLKENRFDGFSVLSTFAADQGLFSDSPEVVIDRRRVRQFVIHLVSRY
jgi:hypothetical protein